MHADRHHEKKADDSSIGAENDSFSLIYESHFGRLVVAVQMHGVGHANAEEAVQEAFARTYAKWSRVRQGSNPVGYVYTTAVRLSRRKRNRQNVELSDSDVSESMEADIVGRLELRAALQALPKRQRECLALCVMLEMSSNEAADVLEIDPGTVRFHVHEARKAIEKTLTKYHP